MSDIPRYLRIAKKLAEEHCYEPEMGFKHCAVIVRGGNIISVGFNYVHNSFVRFDEPLAKKSKRFQSENHAEMDAIFGLKGKNRCSSSCKMYVVRIFKGTKQLANSRPCTLCSAAISCFPMISKVYYSISENEYGVWMPEK